MLRVSPKSIETQLLKVLALHPPHQAPLSTGFSRQEYWSGLPFPSLKDLLDSGIKPQVSCIAGKFFRVWATREAHVIYRKHLYSRNNWQAHCFFIGSDVCHFLLQVLNMISTPMKLETYLCDCWKVDLVSNWFETIVQLLPIQENFDLRECQSPVNWELVNMKYLVVLFLLLYCRHV